MPQPQAPNDPIDLSDELALLRAYVDDFVLLHQDSGQLTRWHQQIQEFLHTRLALKLHPHKTIVQPISRGCDYLGYIVRPHSLQIRPRTIKALRRRLYL